MMDIQPCDILPFFEKHADEFVKFFEDEYKEKDRPSLCRCLEAFVEYKGIPFNMKTYMSEQSKHIKECLAKLDIQNKSDKERQVIVAKWIHNEAHLFRAKVIQDQVHAIHDQLNLFAQELPKCILNRAQSNTTP